MKAALIHTPLTTSTGGERQVLRLAIELEKRGHEIEVFTNEADPEKCFPGLISKVKVNVIPYPRIPGFSRIPKAYRQFFGMREIAKAVSKKGFDVVNNHNHPTEWAVYFIKNREEIPAVWMCNEPPFWFFMPGERRGLRMIYWPLYEIFDRMAVRRIDKIITLSTMTGGLVQKAYGRDFEVIRSGVDAASPADGAAFRKKYGLGDSIVFLQVGTLVGYKRPEDSIKALATVMRVHKDVKLVLVGPEDAAYRRKLDVLVESSGLAGNVAFTGPLPDGALEQAYAACDVFLFPSFQSWSLVATEAMAYGKPVIVSDNCGVSEVIKDGENGFIMPHGDVDALAKSMGRLIDDNELRGMVGENARQYILKNLSWVIYAEKMDKALMSQIK